MIAKGSICGMLCFKESDNANYRQDLYCLRTAITTIMTIYNWFKKYKIGNFDSKNEGRNDRLVTTETDLNKAMFAENPRCSSRNILQIN